MSRSLSLATSLSDDDGLAQVPQLEPKRLTVLGSTGSVGCSTLDLVARDRERFQVTALTANSSVTRLAQQAREFQPDLAVIAQESCYQDLKEALSGTGIEVAAGREAVAEAAARDSDIVMAAIVGAAGLEPVLAATRRGAVIALANKETLVCAGSLMTEELVRHKARFLPVDSEHNAIFQVFDQKRRESIDKIILTASGGPFRQSSQAEMAAATPEQAIAHPVWSMGAKISIDSATMMNKGLEIIEAHYLFDLPSRQIDVLIHPQSVIHSMVAYVDGSVLAQLGQPDMRTPIAYALAWPDRMVAPVETLDLAAIGQLEFAKPDEAHFPALRLARQALESGGNAATVLNAANEVAVAAFLEKKIGFLDIARLVERCMEKLPNSPLTSLAQVSEVDLESRRLAEALICDFPNQK
ncbi:1-deoxy-D-xylulose-5-phosphate reductoisomerase [Rhodovibrionaceae bacterium A322]